MLENGRSPLVRGYGDVVNLGSMRRRGGGGGLHVGSGYRLLDFTELQKARQRVD